MVDKTKVHEHTQQDPPLKFRCHILQNIFFDKQHSINITCTNSVILNGIPVAVVILDYDANDYVVKDILGHYNYETETLYAFYRW